MKTTRAIWGGLVLLMLAGSVRAGRDMTYVEGLIAREYYELAIEHLDEMRTRADVPEEDKVLIPLKLGRINNALAAQESDPQGKERYLARAAQHLEEFATSNPKHEQILNVSLERVDILSGRAQTFEMRYRTETDVRKKAEIRKQTEDFYRKGLEAAKTIVDEATKKVKELRPQAVANQRLMKTFWVYYEAQMRGMFLLGHQEYLWAQLYPAKDDNRKKHLETAVTHFDTAIKQRPKTNVTFDSHVRRGMCLRELAVFEKNAKERDKKVKAALDAFMSALTVKKTPLTAGTRAEAHFQKALTAEQLADYEAAASAADGYLSEHPLGKNSFRGQQALLVKARSLGRLAKTELDRKEPDWQETYNEALRAVKEVLPDYPSIREEADKLVQAWGPMFPVVREVVISPLIAAAQAKKLYAERKLDEAIEKYREVITLSGDREEYADFAEDAWKAVGKVYYDTRRLYMSALAWRELLVRFPDTFQGAEFAWARTEIFRYLYNASGEDRFDLDEYLGSLSFFVEHFPKDERVYQASTESAKVYAIRGELTKAAEIWSKTDPENPRYAEAMTEAGELYHQAFVNLAKAGQGATPKATEHLSLCTERLRQAADAKRPAGSKENYNALALARLVQIFTDEAVPQPESARKVPPLVDEFRRRFPQETALVPAVLLAGAQAYVMMEKPYEAEKLALDIEKGYAGGVEYETVKQLMVVAFQRADPARANEWQKKQVGGDLSKAPDTQLETLGNRAWQQKNYPLATRCFVELVRRYRNKDPNKHRGYEDSLAAIHFAAAKNAEAKSFYGKFLPDARTRYERSKTVTDRNKLLLAMRRLAECEEMGGDPNAGIKLWNEFSGLVFASAPPNEWFEARYHLANCYYRLKQYNAAKDIIKRVEVLYGGFGTDQELKVRVETLKKTVGYETTNSR